MRVARIVVGASVALNAGLIVIGRGSFTGQFIALAIAIYLGLPVLIASALSFIPRKRSPTLAALSRVALCAGLVALSAAVSLPIGTLVLRRDIAAAKRYCEDLVPGLDAYKRAHGHYPKAIDTVTVPAGTPRLLRPYPFYTSDGASFSFWFANPGGLMDGCAYDSNHREWSEWH